MRCPGVTARGQAVAAEFHQLCSGRRLYPANRDGDARSDAFSGAERVTVIGRAERLDLFGAAFINAVAGNLLDYDDTHLRTVIHPTAPVAPAALALAEQRGLSGAEMLHAFILGAEVECRIGNTVSPGHYARGWHITSTRGVFGSAVASAKLLGLNAEQTRHALGIAASQSAGLVENIPSAAKNVSVGNAARSGLFAALLAEQGCTAAPAAIEGALGPRQRPSGRSTGARWKRRCFIPGAVPNSHCLIRTSRRRCENSLGMALSQGGSMMSSQPPGNSTSWE